MTTERKHPPNRLKYWRETRGLTLEKVAELADFTPQTLNRYENGSRPVSIDTLLMLAELYRVTPGALINSDHDELSPEERLILRRLRTNPAATVFVRSMLGELETYDALKSGNIPLR